MLDLRNKPLGVGTSEWPYVSVCYDGGYIQLTVDQARRLARDLRLALLWRQERLDSGEWPPAPVHRFKHLFNEGGLS
jgi:hypothetical protein